MSALLLATLLSAAVQLHCDLPGGDLSNSAQASPEACAAVCAAEAGCKAWTFISGWNRCFLKAKLQKQAKLRIHAAQVDDDGKGGRQLGKIHEDHDDSGKDLRRVTKVKTAEACGQECLAEPQCQAIAFLDGYGDCWLKKSKGRTRPKIFSCGTR
jgi:hypothetical protein